MADMHVSSLDEKHKKKLMEDLFAFCEAHPVHFEPEPKKIVAAPTNEE